LTLRGSDSLVERRGDRFDGLGLAGLVGAVIHRKDGIRNLLGSGDREHVVQTHHPRRCVSLVALTQIVPRLENLEIRHLSLACLATTLVDRDTDIPNREETHGIVPFEC